MKDSYKQILLKYKKFLVPLALNLLSVFLIFWVILPQFSSIGERNTQINAENETISTLKQSLNTIATARDDVTDKNYTTTTTALPTSKNLALIFTSLSEAGSKSNVQIESFSLTVGGVYGKSAQEAPSIGAPSLRLIAQIKSSNPRSFIDFGNELATRLPLAEIRKVSLTDFAASYEIGYFYKPYDLNKITKEEKIPPLSQSDENLLNQLRTWEHK